MGFKTDGFDVCCFVQESHCWFCRASPSLLPAGVFSGSAGIACFWRLILMLGFVALADVQAGAAVFEIRGKQSEACTIAPAGNALLFTSRESDAIGMVSVSAVDVVLTRSKQRRRLMSSREHEHLVLMGRSRPGRWAWQPHKSVSGKLYQVAVTRDGPESRYWRIVTIMPEGQGRFKAEANRFYQVSVSRLGSEFKTTLAGGTFLFTGKKWVPVKSLGFTPEVWYTKWPSGGD